MPYKQLYENAAFPEAKWTIIMYINGENDLMYDMIAAYNQLANVGSNFGEVNFVALFDGLKMPDSNRNGSPAVYYITRGKSLQEAFPIKIFEESEDLTNQKNLLKILKELRNKFPAKHYGFIYKGHGGQNPDINNAIYLIKKTVRTIKEDGSFESKPEVEERMKKLMADKHWEFKSLNVLNDSSDVQGQLILAIYYKTGSDAKELSYFKLSKILEEAGFSGESNKLGFLCLDCCWGQLIENGYAFQRAAHYFVASADETPVFGIGYEELADFLLRHAGIKPVELANSIVAIYFKTNYGDYLSAPEWNKMGVSMTCTNMQKFKEAKKQLDRLCDHLISQMKKDPVFIIEIEKARKLCMDYTYQIDDAAYAMYNIDLVWFLENLQAFNKSRPQKKIDDELDHRISALIQCLKLYYIESYLSSNYKEPIIKKKGIGGKGITIVFPPTLESYELSLYPNNKDFKAWKWKKFLNAYFELNAKPRESKTPALEATPADEGVPALNNKKTLLQNELKQGFESKWKVMRE